MRLSIPPKGNMQPDVLEWPLNDLPHQTRQIDLSKICGFIEISNIEVAFDEDTFPYGGTVSYAF
jgi:hypothetical protein